MSIHAMCTYMYISYLCAMLYNRYSIFSSLLLSAPLFCYYYVSIVNSNTFALTLIFTRSTDSCVINNTDAA